MVVIIVTTVRQNKHVLTCVFEFHSGSSFWDKQSEANLAQGAHPIRIGTLDRYRVLLVSGYGARGTNREHVFAVAEGEGYPIER